MPPLEDRFQTKETDIIESVTVPCQFVIVPPLEDRFQTKEIDIIESVTVPCQFVIVPPPLVRSPGSASLAVCFTVKGWDVP